MRALFHSDVEPTLAKTGDPQPEAGPNAVEVVVAQWDPDQRLVVLSLPGDMQMFARVDDMTPDGKAIEFLLTDNKLGPRLVVTVMPPRQMPKFTSPEEADAWLDANS